MSDNKYSRREFLGIFGAVSLLAVAAGCTTTKSSDQEAQKKLLADLRATKKYKEKKIEVGDNYFSPKETTIDPGTIVIWDHIGRSLHDVVWDETSSDLDARKKELDFTSDTLRSGNIHVWLFEEPGLYNYHCHFHGGPKRGHWGSIRVRESGAEVNEENETETTEDSTDRIP